MPQRVGACPGHDPFRTTREGGIVILSHAIAARGDGPAIAQKVRDFEDFDPDNDPRGPFWAASPARLSESYIDYSTL